MGMIANRMLLEWLHKKFGQRSNINDGIETCRNTPGAVLVDVREADEYGSGHVPGAVNIPLSVIGQITYPKDTPLFLYCLRGARSAKAAKILRQMGYREVYSIGGINRYAGARVSD